MWGAMTLVLAVLLCAAGSAAAEPRWSQPQEVGAYGAGPLAAIDDRGQVSMVWSEYPRTGRVLGAVREPGAKSFSRPFEVRSVGGGWTSVHASARGEVAVVTILRNCGARGCSYVPQVRIGPDLRRLGPVQTLGGQGFGIGFAVARDGRMLAAFPSSIDDINGGMQIAEREPGAARFGPPQQLGSGGGTPPRVGLNEDGAAVVAWGQAVADGRGFTGFTPRISVRRAGGRFRSIQRLAGLTGGGIQPQATIASDGSVTAAIAGDRPGYRVRSAGGGAFGPLVPFTSEAADIMTTVANPSGAAAALWDQHIPGTGDTRERPYERGRYVAIRGPGTAAFGPSRFLDIGNASPTAGLDANGNLLLVWPGDRGRLRAGTMTRFDATPSEVTGSLTDPGAVVGGMAVSSSGHAVLSYTEGGERGPIRLLERAADSAPPLLDLGPLTVGPLDVSLPVVCTKDCRAGARITRGGRAVATASRSRVLRRGRTGVVRARLSRKAARRLARRRGKVRVEVRAYDAWGNRRVARRTVSARRLLGRKP